MEQDRIGSAVGALHKRTGVVGDEAASVERQRRGLLLILAVRDDCLGADTVSRDHRNEIRRRVTLHAAPPVRHGIAVENRLGTDGGRVEQQFRALQRHAARGLREPLVPADTDADFRISRIPDLEAGISGRKIELFLIVMIIRDMRLDVFDVLIGINLLREGLDIPEISLVAILDADKEGFLRSETSLIQTVGRAARNAEGHVIMYADNMTDSMKAAIEETSRRRTIQQKYNEEHHITPQTIKKAVRDLISISRTIAKEEIQFEKDPESMSADELKKLIARVEKQMRKAAADLNFEAAAELRDKMVELKMKLQEIEREKEKE